jgi:hypothetical protein
MTRELSKVQLEQRRMAPLTHGARSEARISARARNRKRRFLTRLGVKARDLDAITNEYVDLVMRGEAKVYLRDLHDPHDRSRDYWVAFNSYRRALQALEARLKALGLEKSRRPNSVERYLAEREARQNQNGGEA